MQVTPGDAVGDGVAHSAPLPVRAGQRIFVYGTLRPAANHPMAGALARHVVYCGPAEWRGRLYRLGEYPGAVAGGVARDRVIGDLLRLTGSAGWIMARLDAYEGAGFKRRRTIVTAGNGRCQRAWIYLWRVDRGGRARIPGGDFLARSTGSHRSRRI
ncbi:MAG: gamma-glutamylcyclotransferase family protein [Alphaproteobacteria bacterium]